MQTQHHSPRGNTPAPVGRARSEHSHRWPGSERAAVVNQARAIGFSLHRTSGFLRLAAPAISLT